jgi:hypothetical protein
VLSKLTLAPGLYSYILPGPAVKWKMGRSILLMFRGQCTTPAGIKATKLLSIMCCSPSIPRLRGAAFPRPEPNCLSVKVGTWDNLAVQVYHPMGYIPGYVVPVFGELQVGFFLKHKVLAQVPSSVFPTSLNHRSFIRLGGTEAKMEHAPVHSSKPQGAVLHPGRNVHETALVKDERLIFQPELDFATQIVWVIKVGPEKGKELVKRMDMGLRPTTPAPLAHSLKFVRTGLTKWKKPHTLRVEASRSHLAVQP